VLSGVIKCVDEGCVNTCIGGGRMIGILSWIWIASAVFVDDVLDPVDDESLRCGVGVGFGVRIGVKSNITPGTRGIVPINR
jgi:hypothetical protein